MKYLIILRSIIAVLLYPALITFFTLLIVLSGFSDSTRSLQDYVVGAWARWSLKLFGVVINSRGLEKLPQHGYIALFNHTSNFDIFAVQSIIPRIRFGAKIELFRIPIFGLAMRAAKALPIARAEIKKVLVVYDEAKKRIFKGECFILAPEGTRQSSEKLGPFKSGPFLLAINAQAPIVPIAIKGASHIQPKGRLLPNIDRWTSRIQVIICDPISTVGMTSDSKLELQQKVRDSLHKAGLE